MKNGASTNARLAVVVPCYRVTDQICELLTKLGPEVSRIYVVDDACPDRSGKLVESRIADPRVNVVFNERNLGVGGATIAGFRAAVCDGADVIIKLDGDGQMDPAHILSFANPILSGEADYCKGNRFFEIESLASMPTIRLIGNAALSFMSKLSTGYWHVMDPTNGYVAIHGAIVPLLPLEKISPRYFFESDILFRLNTIGAKVVDIPMHAVYGNEASNLRPTEEIFRFSLGHTKNFTKRVFYNYFIRNFSVASLELVSGLLLMLFGIVFGVASWGGAEPATAGTVMVAALPIIIGFQLLLAFLNYDIQSIPRTTLHPIVTSSSRPLRALGRQPELGPPEGPSQ